MNPLAYASTFFLVFASIVLGAPRAEKNSPAHSTQVCYTSVTTKKGGLHHTRYHDSSTTCHQTASKTVVTTSTPTTVSTTTSTTVKTVTASATTDTATVTTTVTETTTTQTTTDSTTTSTTTVTNFTPVQSSLPLASFNPSFAKRQVKRDLLDRGAGGSSPGKSGYPGSVDCYRYHGQCVTNTVTSTSTKVAPTSTATSTVVTTSTVTTTPGVQTTTTITDTTTSTETDTITNTVTSTQTVSTTADAATACETNDFANYANFVGGQPILTSQADGPDFAGFVSSTATSAYDCCMQAYLNPQGSYFTYLTNDANANANSCYIATINEATCPNGQTTDPGNVALLGAAGNPQAVVGNSGCGIVNLTG